MGIIQHKNFAYLKGPKGDQGPRGLTGDRGARGDIGPQGLRGPQGEPADNTVVRGLISADAPVLYNSTTGKISFDDTNFASKSYVDSAINNQMIYSSDDVDEGIINHYFTDARARSAINASGDLSYNFTTGVISYTTPSTSSIAEGSNLYFTDARARSAISGGTGIVYDSATGLISIGQNVGTTDNVIFGNINASGDVQIDGNLIVNGTTITISATELAIADNMIYLNDGNTVTNPDLGFAGNYNDGTYHHAGFFRDASDGYWKVFDSYQPEPDASPNIDITHASFNLAKIQATEFKGNLDGKAATATRLQTPRSISGIPFDGSNDITLTTTNISEGTSLYFTTARSRSAINASGDLSYDSALGVISYTTPSTSSIVEGSNLYFTNARARSAISGGTGISYNSTTGVISSTITQYTDSMAIDANASAITIAKNEAISVAVADTTAQVAAEVFARDAAIAAAISGHDNTDEITEGITNLYFTDTRARAAISQGTGISYNSTTGVVSADSSIATKTYVDNAVAGKDNTDEITEGLTNLYFTTARSRSAISQGTGISYNNTTGVISSTITQYTDSMVRSAISQGTGISYNSTTGVVSADTSIMATKSYVDSATGGVALSSTDDLAEGTSNLYFTTSKARAAISASGSLSYNSTTGVISYTTPSTSGIAEGTNLYFTTARARAAISASGSLSYNSTTGVISFTDVVTSVAGRTGAITLAVSDITGAASTSYVDNSIANLINSAPTALDTLNELATALGNDANFSTTITNNIATKLSKASNLSDLTNAATARSNLGLSNVAASGLYSDLSGTPSNVSSFTNDSGYVNFAGARAAFSASGSLSYNSTTGVISYTTPSTSGIAEGSNLYFTDARSRAAISASGSLSYNSTTGVINFIDAVTSVAGKTGAVSLVVADVSGAASTNGSNASGTWGINISGTAASSTTHIVTDSRSVVTTPQTINQGVVFDFKQNTTDGLSDGGTYFGEMTFRPYGNNTDWTGGLSHQLGFTDNGNIWQRSGSNTSWDAWKKILDTSNVMSGLNTGPLSVTGAITSTGEITAYYSDVNLKTNINLIPNALSKVQQLRGVTFDPNEAALALGIENKHQMGVIAQDVEVVAPELVTESAFEGYKTVRYDKLTALLIEAVKELSAEVNALKARLGE